MADYAKPDSIVTTDWVTRTPERPQGPADRGRRRHRRLRHRPRPRGRRLELEVRSRDARRPRRRRQGRHREAALTGRRRQRHDNHPLRRQQQLVRRLRPVAAEVLRRRQREADERRPQEVDRRRASRSTTDAPSHKATNFTVKGPDTKIRAFRDEVLKALGQEDVGLVDVRSPKEYSGELLAPENLPQEGSQRGGHIPGAKSIPWATAVNEDGTFKSREELEEALRRPGHHAGQGDHRLLPHRRALGAHVVRAHAPARLPERPQLRRLVDGVGVARRRTDRKVARTRT